MAIAWGLVAAATPLAISGQTGHSAGADPFGSGYRSMTPEGLGAQNNSPVTQTQFDFVTDGPVRRYATPNAPNPFAEEDEGAAGFGLGARVGHSTGNTVGRDLSITNFELMPYVISGDGAVIGSFRFFRADNSELGGSTSLGYRHFIEDWNKIFGVHGSYFLDDHRGVSFEQVAMGLELLGDTWDLRSNWYTPTGVKTQIVGTSIVAGSERFSGNNLLFSSQTDVESAAEGFDVMLTVPVPGEWMAAHNVEASAGFYHFASTDTDAEGLWGYRLRADGGFWNDLAHLFVELNSDDQTDVGVTFGVSLDWHGGINTVRRRGGSQKNRLVEFMRQNDHVVTIAQPVITADVTAINPNTGVAYTIAHVDRNRNEAVPFDPTSTTVPLGGLGTPELNDGRFEDPFNTANGIVDALATGSDIVFVAGGPANSFTTPVTIGAGQALLGEATGVDHLIEVEGFANPITLPSPTADRVGLVRPTIGNAVGTAVTFSDNSRFGGFVVDGDTAATGTSVTLVGINVPGTSGGQINDVTLLNIGDTVTDGVGIQLVNATGAFTMENFQIGQLAGGVPSNGASGTSFLVSGGTASINTLGTTAPTNPAGNLIANSDGFSLVVQNTLGGNIGLSNMNIVGASPVPPGAAGANQGILITTTLGGVVLGDASIANAGGSAIQMLNVGGDVSMLGNIEITYPTFAAAADAFVIDNLLASGQINGAATSTIAIDQNTGGNRLNQVGLQLHNISGTVNIGGTTTINGGGVFGVNPAPAVNFQNSSGAVTLNNLNISNRFGGGVNIGDINTAVDSTFDLGDPDLDETNAASAAFTLAGVSTITNTGVVSGVTSFIDDAAFQVFNDFSTVQTNGLLTINDRVGLGVVVAGTQPNSRVSFSSLTIDDDGSTSLDEAILVVNNQAPVSFGTVEINDTNSVTDIVLVLDNNRAAVGDPLSNARVSFNELSILNANLLAPFSALWAQDNDSFNVDGGTFEVTGGRAVTAINNLNTLEDGGSNASIEDFLRFDSISVDGATADAAVLLDNNRGDFEIAGTPGSAGTGGTIDGTGFGIVIRNLDGQVDIVGVDFDGVINDAIYVDNRFDTTVDQQFQPNVLSGGAGRPATPPAFTAGRTLPGDPGFGALGTIVVDANVQDDFRVIKTALNVDTVNMSGIGTTTGDAGIRTFNVDEVIVDDTTIEMNFGTAIDLDVLQTTATDLGYVYDIQNSILEGSASTDGAILNVDFAGTDEEDTTLALLIANVAFDSNGVDIAAVDVSSQGSVNASVLGGANNTINVGSGLDIGTQSAIMFEVGDAGNASAIEIRDYIIDQDSSDGTIGAIEIEADGDLGLEIDNNIFNVGSTINSIGGFAIELDLNAPGTDVEIDGNIFNMFETGHEVVEVSGIVGPADFTFQNNTINFTPSTFLNTEVVLQFNSATGLISLDGDNNEVPTLNFGTTFFLGNAANFLGSVEINGTPVP